MCRSAHETDLASAAAEDRSCGELDAYSSDEGDDWDAHDVAGRLLTPADSADVALDALAAWFATVVDDDGFARNRAEHVAPRLAALALAADGAHVVLHRYGHEVYRGPGDGEDTVVEVYAGGEPFGSLLLTCLLEALDGYLADGPVWMSGDIPEDLQPYRAPLPSRAALAAQREAFSVGTRVRHGLCGAGTVLSTWANEGSDRLRAVVPFDSLPDYLPWHLWASQRDDGSFGVACDELTRIP